MQLPVVVVVVAEPGPADRRQRRGRCHRPGVKSAVVGGAAVERVPVEAGEDDGRGARGQQHRVLAARSGRQDVVDAEHAHRHAPNRAGAGQRGPAAGGREGGCGGGRGRPEETGNRNFSEEFWKEEKKKKKRGLGEKRAELFPRAAGGQSVRVCLRAAVRVNARVCVRWIHPWNFPPSTLACLLISTQRAARSIIHLNLFPFLYPGDVILDLVPGNMQMTNKTRFDFAPPPFLSVGKRWGVTQRSERSLGLCIEN